MTVHLTPSQAKHIKGAGKTAGEYDPQKDGAASYYAAIEAKRRRGDNYYLRDKIVSVVLPWPHKDLSPNARVGWRVRHRRRHSYKHTCVWACVDQGIRKIEADSADVIITFFPPDARRRDIDNMLASVKTAIDAVAEAIGVDDSKWSISIRKEAPRPPFGAVRVEIVGKGGL